MCFRESRPKIELKLIITSLLYILLVTIAAFCVLKIFCFILVSTATIEVLHCLPLHIFQLCTRPDRLRPVADRYNLDQEAVLDNVLYARAYTSEQQMELLDFVCAKFHEEPGVFKLLIVDSLMALFRVDFSGRGELAERQQSLAQMLSKLQKISEEYNVAVLVTNQMTADPGATMSFQADPKKPIGGNIVAHASTTRVSLRKGRGELRIAKIYDSPDLPESEATFAITAGGLDDAKD